MRFDYVNRIGNIDYGIVKGGQKILFVKTGLGSDYLGYKNKYLKMALNMRECYGISVIVASNPYDNRSHIDEDKLALRQYIQDEELDGGDLLFFGHSNGGIKGLALTEAGLVFTKMLLVNMPLMINFHKTKRYISQIPETSVIAVYGEKDPSFPYTPFIENKFDNLKVVKIPMADHTFEGMPDNFIALPHLLLEE
jgi:hypothetical protein